MLGWRWFQAGNSGSHIGTVHITYQGRSLDDLWLPCASEAGYVRRCICCHDRVRVVARTALVEVFNKPEARRADVLGTTMIASA